MKRLPLFMAFLAFLQFLPLRASADNETILWQIGEFNGTSDEFSPGMGSAYSGGVYVIGKSVPDKNWAAYQGVKIERSKPRVIKFNLDKLPSVGVVHLRISVLFLRASIPAMQIGVNGKMGVYYLQPRLDYRMGDSPGGNRSAYSEATLETEIPAGLLMAGANELSIIPIATNAEFVPDAGINYDAIALLHKTDAQPISHGASCRVEPTVFYKNIDGKLCELIHVFVRYNEKPKSGDVTLHVNGKEYRLPLMAGQDFGEERLEFWVLEFTGEAASKTTVRIDGRLLEQDVMLKPEKKWTVFVVPNVHLDLGYTDYHSKVAVLQSRLLEQSLDLCENNPDFRFSMDGSWTMKQYMRMRSPAERQRLIKAMQEKRVFMPAQPSSLMTGFPTSETLLRSFYESANFAQKHGTPFNYTATSDVPSPSWAYASIMASAGLKYFLSGSNSDRGPIVMIGRYNETSPMWWEGPDGKRVLFWYSRVYRQVQMLFGLPPIVDAGRDMLPVFLQAYQRPHYTSDATILWGTQGENRELFPQQATLINRWNSQFAYPNLKYSGVADAIHHIAAQLGDKVPVVRGDGGPYWEDDLAANPESTGLERRTERQALNAEKLQTISALINPRLSADKEQLDKMWEAMLLYDEHTAASHTLPAHEQMKITDMLEVKKLYAVHAADLAKHLAMEASANLIDSMNVGRNHVVVFNALNWNRDGLVTYDLPNGMEMEDVATGEKVPFDITSKGGNFLRINFFAKNVPAMGYKVLRLRPASKKAGAQDAAEEVTMNIEDYQDLERGVDIRPQPKMQQKNPATVMENKFYRVELDAESGAIKSILDKELNRELVDKDSPYKFGQYVFVTGGDAKPNGLLQYAKKPPPLAINFSEKGNIVYVRKISFGQKARLESSAIYTSKIITEICLWDDVKKIDINYEVRKDQIYRREGVYFAFPFAMKEPQFLYEIANTVVDPAKDILYGGSLEWFLVQSWIGVQQNGLAGVVMPLDAPVATLGDIIRGEWPTEFGKRPGTIFSHVINKYHQPRSIIDFKAEVVEDRLKFRHVITSDTKLDRVKLSKMGWGEMTPLEWSLVQAQDKSWIRPQPLGGESGSFVEVKDDAIVLLTMKQAEDGRGTILRFQDIGGAKRIVSVKTSILKLRRVTMTDGVERDLSGGALTGEHEFKFEISTNEIVTIRLEGEPALRVRQPGDGLNDDSGLASPFGGNEM